MLRRVQFFEFEDQTWFPTSLRDGITDFLRFAVSAGDLYRPVAGLLDDAVRRSGARRVVDLCAGGGGPWTQMLGHVPAIRDEGRTLTLTDYYPNLEAFQDMQRRFPGVVDHVPQQVSATAVPVELSGFRTLFSSFHHFAPADARSIIADTVKNRQGIAIFESTQRHPLLLLYMLLVPLIVLLTSPFQKPFRWSRMFWTYVIPLVPLLVCFDGIVSCLRTYTPAELLAMARAVPGGEDYEWRADVQRIGILPVGVTYLIGLPRTDTLPG